MPPTHSLAGHAGTVLACTMKWVSLFGGLEWTTGPLEWTTGTLEWTTGILAGRISHAQKMGKAGLGPYCTVTWFCNYSDKIAMCILSLQCTLHSGLLPIL